MRRTQKQIKDDDAKAALALKKNTRPIAMLLQKKQKQQPKQQQQAAAAKETAAPARLRQSPRRNRKQQGQGQQQHPILIDSTFRFRQDGSASFDAGVFGQLVTGEAPPPTVAQDPTPIFHWRVMIYDKDEDTPQWKMAIVQGRADDGDNDNNVLVDYVRDPYKQSGVAVSLRLDNFGDDANDNKTCFRIDYHKAIRMRMLGSRPRVMKAGRFTRVHCVMSLRRCEVHSGTPPLAGMAESSKSPWRRPR